MSARKAAAVLAGLVLLLLVAEPAGLGPAPGDPTRGAWFAGATWLAFAAGAWLVWRLPVRAATVLIVAGGLALPLAAGFEPPRSSDDLYRYIWDGRVQASGIDPYHYAPADPALAHLRDGYLWPEHANWCVDGACTLINRPAVHTIYPPVAEAYFTAVHLLPGDRYGPYQVAAAAIAFAVTVLLVMVLPDPRRAVLWAWCPAVAYEAGSNAHVDVLAAGLTALGLLWLARGRSRPGGVVLGLAIATKLTPLLVLPAVVRRRPVAVVTAAIGAVVAVYLPHVLAVGGDVLGYLPGYLSEEGYATGTRFALLPRAWATPLAAAVLVAVAVWVVLRADPDRPWLGAATMTGSALLVTSPTYPWYALLLVVLVALGARVEWLAVAAAGYLAQWAHDIGLATPAGQRIGYGTALLVVVLGLAVRRLLQGSHRQRRRGLDLLQPQVGDQPLAAPR